MTSSHVPRVVHLAPAIFDANGRVTGGAERYALELSRHMADQTPVRLVTFGARDERRRAGALDVHVLGGQWAENDRAHDPFSVRIASHIRWATVVHAHQREIRLAKGAAVMARLLRRKVVVTDHGGGAWGIASMLPTARLFDAHLHVSDFSRRQAGHADLARAQVIYGGVDTRKFHGGAASVDPRCVLFVGRILPHKGLDDLIAGLPAGMRLEICGRAHDPAYLETLRVAAAGQDVRFFHNLDDDAIAAKYRSALCVALPSVYRTASGIETSVPELLGQTVLEAMASGRPVIVTDVGALPEIVTSGRTGIVVGPNSPPAIEAAIRRLRDDPAFSERLASAASAQIRERFTWARTVARCLRAYG